ncbi:amidohydrolase family protein [Occallatibacter savannae]|uniref:amidohydrolase family protein n=1 Tax=Occallatibacter savannae TaxID=1002691 RepID=UPI0013A54DCE|nr:amidohydrolase family protein [Occallatibacter savannae]
MQSFRNLLALIVLLAAGTALAQNPTPPASAKPPLVLLGGTIVNVSDWGRSALDQQNSIVIIENGKITQAGSRFLIETPPDAQIIDCTGKFLVPGLVDGFTGMNSQAQASADLYMGITTIVASSDNHRGRIDFSANPKPHLYLLDSVGTTDNWSLLNGHDDWSAKLREGARPVELNTDDTARQIAATAKLGTRVLWLGWDITAANAQWIISRAHQMGLVTYGEFISTPYTVGIDAGVDALLHMGRYEIGVIPDELQRPLVNDPYGAAASTAYDYAEHLPPTDPHYRNYGHFISVHHAALMPTFSQYYLSLPGHRNLWKEPVASILNSANMYMPSDPATGELNYPLAPWTRHLPAIATRYMQEGQRKKADQAALRLWRINQTIAGASPHYLAASGAATMGTMPGISLHTELEMLVRIGLSPREALAAATNNYAIQFGWNELGQISAGRRADILVLDADPTANIWNVRRISTMLLEGNVVDRDALLKPRK